MGGAAATGILFPPKTEHSIEESQISYLWGCVGLGVINVRGSDRVKISLNSLYCGSLFIGSGYNRGHYMFVRFGSSNSGQLPVVNVWTNRFEGFGVGSGIVHLDSDCAPLFAWVSACPATLYCLFRNWATALQRRLCFVGSCSLTLKAINAFLSSIFFSYSLLPTSTPRSLSRGYQTGGTERSHGIPSVLYATF